MTADERHSADRRAHSGDGERDIEAKGVQMLAAGKMICAHLREPITSDHCCLYDKDGFPR
jgi:hypothetical protein